MYNIESAFLELLKHLTSNDLLIEYKDRCYAVVNDSQDIGYGFGDEMFEMYWDVYSDVQDKLSPSDLKDLF